MHSCLMIFSKLYSVRVVHVWPVVLLLGGIWANEGGSAKATMICNTPSKQKGVWSRSFADKFKLCRKERKKR